MNSALQMLGLLALVFVVSMTISYVISHPRRRRKLTLVPLPENTSVRMIGPGGVYRCHFLRQSKAGLTFSAPLQRDVYVPLRVGEIMMIQAPLNDSVVTFRAAVIGRDADTHEFTLATPERIRHVDRRVESRDTNIRGRIVALNGQSATILDLSAGGAKVLCQAHGINAGDAVRLNLPDEMGVVYGWALEAIPTADGAYRSQAVRIRFETPLDGLGHHHRRVLYLGD